MQQIRAKRLPVNMELKISTLFKQDTIPIENLDAPIHVINMSKTGIGFTSTSKLPLNYYFNTIIQLGAEDSTIYSVVRIVRGEALGEDEFYYGCEFVGLAPVFDYVFDHYTIEFEEQE